LHSSPAQQKTPAAVSHAWLASAHWAWHEVPAQSNPEQQSLKLLQDAAPSPQPVVQTPPRHESRRQQSELLAQRSPSRLQRGVPHWPGVPSQPCEQQSEPVSQILDSSRQPGRHVPLWQESPEQHAASFRHSPPSGAH
jgi:hypothetical protein